MCWHSRSWGLLPFELHSFIRLLSGSLIIDWCFAANAIQMGLRPAGGPEANEGMDYLLVLFINLLCSCSHAQPRWLSNGCQAAQYIKRWPRSAWALNMPAFVAAVFLGLRPTKGWIGHETSLCAWKFALHVHTCESLQTLYKVCVHTSTTCEHICGHIWPITVHIIMFLCAHELKSSSLVCTLRPVTP